ncbi:MAG: N-acetylmuramoyl-L-alanine amidase [Flavobacteriales bacterium]|nr:N-acetylmuramoyl-L-alanine amidase [Flavobacteriales bacterium]
MKTIVIDAGHGGNDPGNLGTGRYKTREKDIALEVALMVGGYINTEFPGIKVIYTRSTDVFIGLSERTDVANRAKADLFLSIHCNAATNTSAMGVETFTLGLHKNKENLEVAMKENSAIFLEDDYKTKYEGFDPNSPESIIALTIMQSAYLQQSLTISSYIQTQFKDRVGRKDRGVKQAGFLVLRKTTMPSILVELGFLTNASEEDFLNSENGKSYMASAIFRGFKEYKELVEDPLPEGSVTPAPENKTESPVKVDDSKLKEEERAAAEKAKLDAKKKEDERLAADKVKLEVKKKEDERLAAEKAKLDAKKKEAEKAKQDSTQKVIDQAKLKAVADSLETAKSSLLEEKKKREEELVQKAKDAEKARLKAKVDSLETVRLVKIAAFEAEKKAVEEKNAKELADKKAKEEKERLAQEEKDRKEIESKEEAKKWLEEIKEEKEKELEEARIKAETDAEKAKLEVVKRQKEQELADAQRLADEKRVNAQSDSISAQRLIAQQAKIDSLAKARSEFEIKRNEEAVKAAETEKVRQDELAEKQKQDSLNLAKATQEHEHQKAFYAAELAEAQRLAKQKVTQDSISTVRKKEADALAITIDNQKAASAEEAELLFLQLRKKQLEQRIAQLRGQDVEVLTMEKVEERAKQEPIPKNNVTETVVSGLSLRVQIVTSPTPLTKNDPQLKGQNVWQYQQDGLYKYTVGDTQDFDEITKLQGDLRGLGFQGAFVVAFKDGERIKVSDARELLKK